ncbi:MAG TPA: hypothetical protein VMU92_01925 [Acidobacteriaceae bacterium]|nr:hypothetical protein [Acidobacteriaceae bacterium]
MFRKLSSLVAVCLCRLTVVAAHPDIAAAQNRSGAAHPVETIAKATQGMQHMPGLIALDWDARTGKLYMEVPMTGNGEHTRSPEYIYTHSMPAVCGSAVGGGDASELWEWVASTRRCAFL